MSEDTEAFETEKVADDERHYIPVGETAHQVLGVCVCQPSVFIGALGILAIHHKYPMPGLPKKWYK